MKANRVQVAVVRETTPGTTPTTPRMRLKRFTGAQVNFAPEYVDSDEIRSDRMLGDPILVMQAAAAPIRDELSYPDDESPDSEFYRSLFYSAWSNTPQRDNDGSAASVITDVAASSDTYTVTTGAAFVEGQLVRATGFGQAGNNSIFRAQSGSGATAVVAPSSPGLTDEASPAADARLKVVGFQGASGDIETDGSGLISTTLDFTTLGLVVGQWLKLGGTATGDKFATAANNAWVRISGTITAHDIPLDNLPSGWGTDDGSGKTIKVWFGDQIKNGTTKTALTIERGFLGQSTPTYIVGRGLVAATCQHSIASRQKVTRNWTFQGMGGGQSQAALDASPDAQTAGAVMAANANVGRLAEAGAVLTNPNWARAFEFTINNNLRNVEDVQEQSPVDINEGEFTVTGRADTYFGDNTLLAKFYAGTPTSFSSRIQKNGQAMIFQFPRVVPRTDGNPDEGAKNTDIMLPFGWQSSYDSVTAAHAILDRVEYYE